MTTAAEDKNAQRAGTGMVYVLGNQATGNSVTAFERGANGVLTQRGTFPTGGLGTGGVTNPLDPLFSQGSLAINGDHSFLFAVDAGSNEVSVLAIDGDKLIAVDRVPSGGTLPVSVTIHKNLVYVLHRGDPVVGDGNVTGFTVDNKGTLCALPGSTQPLVGGPGSVPAQVQFTPDGAALVVTERTNDLIDILPIDEHGRAGELIRNDSAGGGPFGFTFAGNDILIVSELASTTSSYRINPDGTLTVISATVPTAEQGACWAVTNSITNPRYAYVSNAVSGSISGYRIDSSGALSLLNPDGHTAVTVEAHAALDSAVSSDDRFLYIVTGGFSETAEAPITCSDMSINAYRIEASGNLTAIPDPNDPDGLAPLIRGLAPGTQGIVAI